VIESKTEKRFIIIIIKKKMLWDLYWCWILLLLGLWNKLEGGNIKKYIKEIKININILKKINVKIHIKGIICGIKYYFIINNVFKLII